MDIATTNLLHLYRDKLTERTKRLCVLLACNKQAEVPAFLFHRPFGSVRRWNEEGQIEESHLEPTDEYRLKDVPWVDFWGLFEGVETSDTSLVTNPTTLFV